MKKIRFIVLILAFIVMLIGCEKKEAVTNYDILEVGKWNDGTYKETAKGKKGIFDVTVEIVDGMINSIIIGDNNETPNRGGVAIKELPDEIIKSQSIEVDGVSGATVTSDGIKDAVARCLEKASK
ncbi:FMN-binding protein [Clostridium nigeriense]|uniref:FMN-binding protein n=1 Tax=Clostridium nigeriense TaxID=1805470 RepID=UPI003D355391